MKSILGIFLSLSMAAFAQAAEAEKPQIIDVQAKSGQVVELHRGKPFVLKFPKQFANQLVDVKASSYPVMILRSEIPKDAFLPNYFSCIGYQAAIDPKDPEIVISNGNPADDSGISFSWHQLDRKGQVKTKLVPRGIDSASETELYLTVSLQKKSKQIRYDLYESMRKDERRAQIGWRSDIKIHEGGKSRENDMRCTVPEFSVRVRLVDAESVRAAGDSAVTQAREKTLPPAEGVRESVPATGSVGEPAVGAAQ
ncbi:MAG: hypothetical protein NDJ90_00625 [Oligoflexia bacterium]|nr:hypothetical protein [Oligoflexia bacterium]